MRSHNGMRPQDVLILLKLVVWEDRPPRAGLSGGGHTAPPWKQLDLARELGLGQTEVSDSLNRSRLAGLVDAEKRKPMRGALADFLVHGLKYVFPVEPGGIVRGMPTAHSAPPLVKQMVDGGEPLVWPCGEGEARGQGIEPLYPSVPQAARRDPQLYELLALLDALRVGRVREQKLAREELHRRLLEPAR